MLAEWYLTTAFEAKNNGNVGDFEAEMNNIRKFIQTPPGERGEWEAISSYVATANAAGRPGFTAIKEQVKEMLESAGLRYEDLSNEAKLQYLGKAVYFPKGTGMARAFAASDTAQGAREVSNLTADEEASPAGGEDVNVGQYQLTEMREGMAQAGRRATSEEDTRRAVMQDEIVTASSIFSLPPLRLSVALARSRRLNL